MSVRRRSTFCRAGRGDEAFGVLAVGRFQNVVAEIAQDADGEMPHADLVLEDEDGFGAGEILALARVSDKSSGGGAGWRGRKMRKVVPWPGALSAQMWPPLCLTMP